MRRTSVVLVDDHRIIVDAIEKLLQREFAVVGKFDDGKALLESVGSIKPDVIVLDISMPSVNGLTIGSELKKLLPKTKLIFLTMHTNREAVSRAFKLGASGYVLKSASVRELMDAIREVTRGGYYASPELTEGIMGSFVQAFKRMERPRELTERQKEVLQLISDGLTMKEIASKLKITVHTVAFHKYTIMKNLDITSTAELILYGLDLNSQKGLS